MARKNVISMEACHELFSYDPETGYLYWKHRARGPSSWNAKYAGKRAFTSRDTDGYFAGAIYGKPVRAQYVVWAMHHGTDFPEVIDHANRVRTDNRIENLRASSSQLNAWNRSAMKGRDCPGVSQTKYGTWRVRAKKDKISYCLGTYKSKDEAISVYMKFKTERESGVN